VLGAVLNDAVITLLRMGKADQAVELVRKASQRFPQSPLAQQAAQLETLKAQGKLDTIDTSPLVLRFAADAPITLDPKLLALDTQTTPTTGSDKGEEATTGTTVASTDETSR
jgi:hypothetical protein